MRITRPLDRRAGNGRFTIVRGRLARLPGVASTQLRGADAIQLHAKVARWYGDMAPSWLQIEPILRRRLVLRVHQWIVGSALVDGTVRSDVLDDLGPGGPLASVLTELIPQNELRAWRPWIRLVLHDLRRAFRWPRSGRTESWWRWVFLIPYSVPTRPTPGMSPVRAVPDGDRPA